MARGRWAIGWISAFLLCLIVGVTSPGEVNGPYPAMQVPLLSPRDGKHRTDLPETLRFNVDASGFVTAVHFVGPAPEDSSRILERARRWIWIPRTSTYRGDPPFPSQVERRVPVEGSVLEIARPDSALLGVLSQARVAKIGIRDDGGKGWERDVDASQLVRLLSQWLAMPEAYEGETPWQTHRFPWFNATMQLGSGAGTVQVDLARQSAWMMVSSPGRLLFVPYGRIRRQVDDAFRSLLPDSSLGVRTP